MRRIGLLALCLCGLACGCAGTATYNTTVKVAPAAKPGEYVVAANVRERCDSWHSPSDRSLNALVQCEAGKQASLSVTSDAATDGLVLEAYIAAKGEEKVTTCTVTLKRGGGIVSRTEILLPILVAAPTAPATTSPKARK